VQLIDRFVAEQDLVEERAVAEHQSLDGRAHTLLRQAAHFEQASLQGIEFLVEVRNWSIH
jgi:hypothetical protein